MQTNSLCPKCKGTLYLDVDKDLHCLVCGKTIGLRREIGYGIQNTSRSTDTIDQKKVNGMAMDRVKPMDKRRIWDKYRQNQHCSLVRCRS